MGLDERAALAANEAFYRAFCERDSRTMEGLWARGPSNEILRDERALGRFGDELRKNAERMKARMVSYDPQLGEWTVVLSEFVPKSAQAGRQAR